MFWVAPLVMMTMANRVVSPNPWESKVFYQIFPRSYRDSNGDRIGDFKGIEEGLPTIEKLGCNVILINPIQKSSFYHNYFASDFFDVDPSFGTLQDFVHLIQAAHHREIKIVLDMEPQYVQTGHPWYRAATENPKGPEVGYLAEPPRAASAIANWYKHDQVEISLVNLNNPAVVDEIKKVFEFWSAQGVDGYRIDHMMDDLDFKGESTHLFSKLWTPVEEQIKAHYPGTFFVGEQADWDSYRSPVDIFEKTPTDACFNFRLRNALMTFKKGVIGKGLDEYHWFTKEGRIQLNFLENHDMNRFASEELDPRRQRAAAALMMFAKGAPIVYYGQELGMKGEQGHFGSDGNDVPVRLAYRWGNTLDAPGTALWYKDTGPWWNTRYSKDHDGLSLEEQEGDPHSLFNWYCKVSKIRRSNEALSVGDQTVLDLESETILAFRRQTAKQSVLVLANLSARPAELPNGKVPVGLDLMAGSRAKPEDLRKFAPWQVRVIQERGMPSAS